MGPGAAFCAKCGTPASVAAPATAPAAAPEAAPPPSSDLPSFDAAASNEAGVELSTFNPDASVYVAPSAPEEDEAPPAYDSLPAYLNDPIKPA